MAEFWWGFFLDFAISELIFWSSLSVEVRQGAVPRRGRTFPGYVPGRLFVAGVAGNGHLGANPREEMAKELIGKVSPFFLKKFKYLVNFFQKKGLTLPINFLAISSRGFAPRCPFPATTTMNSRPGT